MSGAGDVLTITPPSSRATRQSRSNLSNANGSVIGRSPMTSLGILRTNNNHQNDNSASIRRNQSMQSFNTLNPNAYWMNNKGFHFYIVLWSRMIK